MGRGPSGDVLWEKRQVRRFSNLLLLSSLSVSLATGLAVSWLWRQFLSCENLDPDYAGDALDGFAYLSFVVIVIGAFSAGALAGISMYLRWKARAAN